jgi:hypothetical protein
MSMAYDKHMEKALATLEDLSARELEVTGEKLSLRRDGLRSFGLVFGDVTQARRGESWSAGNSRFHLETAVPRVDDRLAAQIADAPAPFWAHVRDALAERHP